MLYFSRIYFSLEIKQRLIWFYINWFFGFRKSDRIGDSVTRQWCNIARGNKTVCFRACKGYERNWGNDVTYELLLEILIFILSLAYELKLNDIILFQVNERSITMSELLQAKNENRLIEMFGSGTAAIISPIGSIMYR